MNEVHAHMREMLEVGVMEPRQSPWCNTVVLVHKKDGGLHFCIDFHKLITRTKKDSYPLPPIQQTIESIVGAGYFSCLDLKTGFWQVAMDKASKQYTALTMGNIGYFECELMVFGLCNAPATFQRLMQNCLGKLKLMYCLIYLDDMIVFSKMKEEHLQHVYVVFDCFREHNLKLKSTKCEFFWSEIQLFGSSCFQEGVQPSKENLKVVAEFALPQTYIEIRAFLGLVGHYQWFIKRLAKIAQLLHEHLSGEGASKKSEWVMLTEEAQDAFTMLKKACLKAPVLALLTLISHSSWKLMPASLA